MAAAPFNSRFYIGRIHGRVESPETIQLTERHYDALSNNTHYQDFLAHLFTRTRLLFVGFSFLDPAIRNVLQLVESKVGKYHLGRHMALLPQDAPLEFTRNLEKFSIQRVLYDPKDAHRELWSAVDSINGLALQTRSASGAEEIGDPFAFAKRYLSACYARNALGPRSLPLRVAVVEGIVSKQIEVASSNGTTQMDLCDSVANELTLTREAALPLVEAAIPSLVGGGLVKARYIDGANRYFSAEPSAESPFSSGMDALVKGALDRFIVRSGGSEKATVRSCLRNLFEYFVARRGWDLGAAFASGEVPERLEISPTMREIPECKSKLSPGDQLGLSRAVEHLFQHPDNAESAVLIEMGRASFALELVSRASRDTLFHQLTLPERIYLDANVLLPAFAPGHPFHDVYQHTISRLIEAATSALSSVEIIAYRGFLNEVVSHRRLAIDQMESAQRNDLAALRKEALLYGTINMNVYVGAFANTLATEKTLTFPEYLDRHAPYRTETELIQWLGERNILVKDDYELKRDSDELPDILHTLEKANNNGGWKKGGTLILHDAVQVAALARDIRMGRRSVFVSADRRLRENLWRQGLTTITNAIMSHVGLAQLVDLLVGAPNRDRGLARMLWGSKTSTETEQIRNYLIDLALDHYHDGFAMQMGKVVDDIAEDVVIELGKHGLRLDSNDAKLRGKALAIIDGFEERYFKNMRELIERARSA